MSRKKRRKIETRTGKGKQLVIIIVAAVLAAIPFSVDKCHRGGPFRLQRARPQADTDADAVNCLIIDVLHSA